MSEHTIVILGGGFAGTTLAQRLERRMPPSWNIVLLSKENYITYTPLLAEVVGASILPGHAVAPIRQMIRRTRYYRAEVTDLDLDQRELRYRGAGSSVMRYDHLVLACGMRANLGMVPGMAQHALPLVQLGDALDLRNRIILRLEEAELEADPARRQWLTTFVIIGGNFSGIEVTGAVADLLRASHRYYPHLDKDDLRVVVLEAGDRLLPAFPKELAEFARQHMERRGIQVRRNAMAAKVTGAGVEFADGGERLEAGTVISTVGFAPNPLIDRLPLPKNKGFVETAPDMSIPGHPGLWAVGDCAAIVNHFDDQLSPPMAQFALRQARQLADNLQRTIDDQETRPFSYRPRGQIASVGHQKAVARVFGLNLYGFPAWLLWRAVYLARLPTWLRKVQVFFEWSWQMLFPPDVTQFHYARSRDSWNRPRRGKKPAQTKRKKDPVPG